MDLERTSSHTVVPTTSSSCIMMSAPADIPIISRFTFATLIQSRVKILVSGVIKIDRCGGEITKLEEGRNHLANALQNKSKWMHKLSFLCGLLSI